MKSIVTTDITASAAAKIKKGTLDHINAMASEGPVQLAISLIGADYDNTKAYILYGCEDSNASATVFDMSAGLVLWAGELFYTPAQNITVSAGQTLRFYPTPSYTTSTAADPVTFTDGTTHNIHLNNGGVWVGAATGSAATLLDNMIRARLPIEQTYSGTVATNWSTTCKYIRNREGLVKLSGKLSTTGGVPSTGTTIITLPAGYRPRAAIKFPSLKLKGSTLDGCTITISTAGAVQIAEIVTTFGTSDDIYLDHISFYTA